MTAKGDSKNKPRIDKMPTASTKGMNKATPSEVAVPVGRDARVHLDIRKISNGFVVRHSRSTPTGYEEHEVYHPKAPKIAFDEAGVKKAAGKPRDT